MHFNKPKLVGNRLKADIAEKLFKRGYATAKLALRQFTKSNTKISSCKINSKSAPASIPYYHISTEVEGGLSGKAIMMIPMASAQKLFEINIPGMDHDDMKHGFLGELCNIVVSAVITELVDELDIEIFGHVPSTQLITTSDEVPDSTTDTEKLSVCGSFESGDIHIPLYFSIN